MVIRQEKIWFPLFSISGMNKEIKMNFHNLKNMIFLYYLLLTIVFAVRFWCILTLRCLDSHDTISNIVQIVQKKIFKQRKLGH